MAFPGSHARRYMLGSSNHGKGGTEDQAAASTAVTEALAAIHVVQAYNLQVGFVGSGTGCSSSDSMSCCRGCSRLVCDRGLS